MSIFGNIMSAIFKSPAPAAKTPPGAPPVAPPSTTTAATTPAPETTPAATASPPATGQPTGAAVAVDARGSAAATLERVDVAAVLTGLASQNRENLDWRRSIVDLMKLLNLDSSLVARRQLAKELHYTGDMSDSASINIWLHRQVMRKLAENGGKVPAELLGR
jgi:hypothetical protein